MRGDGKPTWLRIRPPSRTYGLVQHTVHHEGLVTVCAEAHCPNLSTCWSGGTATFMLLGDTCTRGCRFCAVKTARVGALVDATEPERLVTAARSLALSYVVLTMVNRDDLSDGGAMHVASCIGALHIAFPSLSVEVLTGDFAGNLSCVATVLAAHPCVFAHNVETVPRLQRLVRDVRASYAQSLRILSFAHLSAPVIPLKSSLMLGLGETFAEVRDVLLDLRTVGVTLVTFGQYLQPTLQHIPVVTFISPAEFSAYRDLARSLGFVGVASGPLVRSSYRAGELFVGGVDGV